MKFGLAIKHFNEQVIVSKAEKGSICGTHLKVLDHIVEVNGIPVTDKDVCREMLIKSMQNNNTASLVIERPVNEDAIANMKCFLEAASSHPTPNNSPKIEETAARHTEKQTGSNEKRQNEKQSRSKREEVAGREEREERKNGKLKQPHTEARTKKSQRSSRKVKQAAGLAEHLEKLACNARIRSSSKRKGEELHDSEKHADRKHSAIVVKGKRDSRLVAVMFYFFKR